MVCAAATVTNTWDNRYTDLWYDRDITYVYKEMDSAGLNYGPKFSMLQDVFMTPNAALH